MPIQSNKLNVFFPDGALVGVKAFGDSSFTDVGAINSAVTATLNWTENQIETANAGKTAKQIKEMTIEGGFTLINLEPDAVEKMGGGLFTKTTTAGTAVTTIPNQVIPAGWNDNIKYELVMLTSSSDSTKLKMATKPVFTSITLDVGGSPEVLAEVGAGAGGDYMIVADNASSSGWSILFNSAGMSSGTPKTKAITIVYGTNTPVATTTLHAGASTAILRSYAMQITHTDDAGKIRRLELYSVDPNSGGFQFNFKGANEEGLEEMPLTFMAKLDTSKTSGRQLMAWTIETGAA